MSVRIQEIHIMDRESYNEATPLISATIEDNNVILRDESYRSLSFDVSYIDNLIEVLNLLKTHHI